MIIETNSYVILNSLIFNNLDKHYLCREISCTLIFFLKLDNDDSSTEKINLLKGLIEEKELLK